MFAIKPMKCFFIPEVIVNIIGGGGKEHELSAEFMNRLPSRMHLVTRENGRRRMIRSDFDPSVASLGNSLTIAQLRDTTVCSIRENEDLASGALSSTPVSGRSYLALLHQEKSRVCAKTTTDAVDIPPFAKNVFRGATFVQSSTNLKGTTNTTITDRGLETQSPWDRDLPLQHNQQKDSQPFSTLTEVVDRSSSVALTNDNPFIDLDANQSAPQTFRLQDINQCQRHVLGASMIMNHDLQSTAARLRSDTHHQLSGDGFPPFAPSAMAEQAINSFAEKPNLGQMEGDYHPSTTANSIGGNEKNRDDTSPPVSLSTVTSTLSAQQEKTAPIIRFFDNGKEVDERGILIEKRSSSNIDIIINQPKWRNRKAQKSDEAKFEPEANPPQARGVPVKKCLTPPTLDKVSPREENKKFPSYSSRGEITDLVGKLEPSQDCAHGNLSKPIEPHDIKDKPGPHSSLLDELFS